MPIVPRSKPLRHRIGWSSAALTAPGAAPWSDVRVLAAIPDPSGAAGAPVELSLWRSYRIKRFHPAPEITPGSSTPAKDAAAPEEERETGSPRGSGAGRWIATPAITIRTPSVSLRLEICLSTMIPTTVAVAGSRASIKSETRARQPRHRELVADIGDHRRAESDADARPAPASGSSNAREASPKPIGMMKRNAIAIAAPRRSTPPLAPASETLCPSTI